MISGYMVIMLSLLVGEVSFKPTMINCNDISYTFTKPNQKYVGIKYKQKEYLTNYTDSDKLQTDIANCVSK
jgi:hypothetical protein